MRGYEPIQPLPSSLVVALAALAAMAYFFFAVPHPAIDPSQRVETNQSTAPALATEGADQ